MPVIGNMNQAAGDYRLLHEMQQNLRNTDNAYRSDNSYVHYKHPDKYLNQSVHQELKRESAELKVVSDELARKTRELDGVKELLNEIKLQTVVTRDIASLTLQMLFTVLAAHIEATSDMALDQEGDLLETSFGVLLANNPRLAEELIRNNQASWLFKLVEQVNKEINDDTAFRPVKTYEFSMHDIVQLISYRGLDAVNRALKQSRPFEQAILPTTIKAVGKYARQIQLKHNEAISKATSETAAVNEQADSYANSGGAGEEVRLPA